MTRRIATAIDIDAPAAAIWRVLVDFPAYPEWNPFIRRITGEAKVGSKLEVTAQPANRKPMTFRPTVRVADPIANCAGWAACCCPASSTASMPSSSSHRRRGCRLRHEETFGGLLVPAFGAMLDDTARSFAELNAALKRRVEG